MIGYVIVAVLCFFIALAYCNYNVGAGYPYFGSSLTVTVNYLMIVIPILTMKCLSEEKKTKTDQLLLTIPTSISSIVCGKFLGMVCVFAIPVLFSCLFPFMLSFKESYSLIIDYSTILAFFLIGCVYISIGMFISSLTESQIIAAVVTFVIFFMFNISGTIISFIPSTSYVNAIGLAVVAAIFALIVRNMTRNNYAAIMVFLLSIAVIFGLYAYNNELYYGLLGRFFSIISFSDGLKYFSNGIFNVNSIVMYISFIILFVFLTVQSVQKRRWN